MSSSDGSEEEEERSPNERKNRKKGNNKRRSEEGKGSEEEEPEVPERTMECLVETHWLPLEKSQIPIAIFCSYLENLYKYPEKKYGSSENKESSFRDKLKEPPEFRRVRNRDFLKFVKGLAKMESSKESIDKLYKSIKTDEGKIRSAIMTGLIEGLNCRKDELSKIPESLDRLANFFKCNIKSDKHEAKCKDATYDIIIKTRGKEIAIINKKKFNLSDNYHMAKFLYKQKILQCLLNEKRLQATIFACPANEEPIDLEIIAAHEKNINDINDYNNKLAELKIKYSKPEESALLDFFHKTYTDLNDEFKELEKEELINAVRKLDNKANIGICGSCYKEEELKKFNCGHNFCNDCIMDNCNKPKVLMKCYFPTCYHIVTPEEVQGEYSYPNVVNNDNCILCKKKEMDGEQMHCKNKDSKHNMCRRCLEGYIRYEMKGRIMSINDDTNKPVFAKIKCPFHKCESFFDSKQVETLFSGTEKYIVGSYEEAGNT